MSDRNDIDEDRTEGSTKRMGGKVKEGTGKLMGDEKMKQEGKADQVEGKVRTRSAASRTR